MKSLSKAKWLLIVGAALALPATGVLSGCSGGNGSSFNSGGNGANPFAGVQAQNGVVTNAQGDPIGTFGFQVAADGTITATLNSDLFDVQNFSVRSAAKKSTRAVITGTGTVNPNTGAFEIVFNATVNGAPQTFTFTGTLSQSGSTFTATNLSYTITNGSGTQIGSGGVNSLTISVVGGGGPGAATGTFNVSGGNAISGSLTSNAGAAFVTSVGATQVNVVASFTEASTAGARTINIGATNPNGLQAGSYNIASDEGTVIYSEVPLANPTAIKFWRATSGTVTVTQLNSSQVSVDIANVVLEPQTLPNNTATGNLQASGSGTADIGATPIP